MPLAEYHRELINERARKNRRGKLIRESLRNNRHEIFVVSIEEMDAIVRSNEKKLQRQSKETWEKMRGPLEVGANYYSAAGDAVKAAKLVQEMGGPLTKVYFKQYGGKTHIILKGRPGLRKVLTGTKYGIKNPKVVTMGLGRVGAATAAKQGGLISIILITAHRVIDYFLTDRMTLTRLIGTLATDVVKVGIATGTGVAVAALVGSATFAVGPLVIVLIVGAAATATLNQLDKRYKITDSVVAALDELGDDVGRYVQEKKKALESAANDAVASVLDAVFESAERAAINFVNDAIRGLLNQRPKLY